jgi:hypothetical protein
MRFADYEEQRIEAKPSVPATCPACKRRVIAKCGLIKVPHWAHAARVHCDSWWEPETPWHRRWKSFFPVNTQEVVQTDSSTGEKHIADVKTANEMVIEFQNSPISRSEIKSREKFYGKMMWIVNGMSFKNDFSILAKMPNPGSDFGKRFFLFSRGWRGMHPPDPEYGVYDHDMRSGAALSKELERHFVGHYNYKWQRNRRHWLKATKPVFIDFEGEYLWWLQEFLDPALQCVKRVLKNELILKNGGTPPDMWPLRTENEVERGEP